MTLTKSEDGKTLTISGKGDLTKLDKTYYFVSTLPGKIFSGDSHTEVGGGASYSSETTYSTRSNVYTEIENFKDTYVENKVTSTEYDFNETGASTYYTWKYDWNSQKGEMVAVTSGTKVDTNSQYVAGRPEGETGYTYFTKSGDEYTRVANISTITSSEGVTKKDIYSDVLKNIGDNVYASADGVTYNQVYTGNTYDSSKKYYTLTYTYSNVNFDFLNANNYLRYENDFIKALWENHTFETVKFANEGNGALLIDNSIVKAILYYQTKNDYYTWYESNTTITSFDLSAATVKSLSQATFTNDLGAQNSLGITDITLPLAEKNDDEMIVPTQVLAALGGVKSTITTVNIPAGYTKIGANAFGGIDTGTYQTMSNMTTVTLPTSLTTIGDEAFTTCSKLTTIVFNEGLKTIGNHAFWSTDLTSINFPSTLDKVDNAAFADCRIDELDFNEGLRYIGAGAFALPSEMTLTTIEIPSSVRYIGPGAFNFRQYQDVYFYGEDAPLMPIGNYSVGSTTQTNVTAFNAHTQMGNNGFVAQATEGTTRDDTSKGYANRENYKGNAAYFCILHYPSGLGNKANDYEDQTRVYLTLTKDFSSNRSYTAGQEADGFSWTIYGSMSQPTKDVNYGYQDTYLGAQYVWPSQSQWGRAYVVASNGYNWNGKDKYYSTLTDDDYAVLKEAGFIEGEISSLTDDQKKALQMNAHLGTRMFVLANPDANSDPDYPIDIKSGGHWWTLVVPFNMTKKQVDTVFGDGTNPTHVCRFNKVDRITTEGDTHVKLYFTDDVYAHKAVKTNDVYGETSKTDVPGDDDVVIYAHEAYMIYPTKKIDYENGERFKVTDHEYVPGSPLPTLVKANKHNSSYTGTDYTEYRFIGNYIGEVNSSKIDTNDEGTSTQSVEKAYVPQYSYMYAKKTNDKDYKFWFWYGKTENGVTWNPNTCVVQATAKDGGKSDYDNIFGGTKAGASQGAKQISVFGDEDDTTAIEKVEIIAGNSENAGIVYNLNGQPVSNGSTAGLAKGIYIQNGKKFIVK